MPTTRTPLTRLPRARITPAAIKRWRYMLELEDACTCPDPDSAPYPGNAFNSADPAHVARVELYRIEHARYEAKRAACTACAQWQSEHAALLTELGVVLKLWELDIYDRADVVDALDAVLDQAVVPDDAA